MFNRKRRSLFMLAATAGGLGLWLWKRRDDLRTALDGYRLYPDELGAWTRLMWRLAGAVREGGRFARRYPYACRDLPYGPHRRHRLDVYRPVYSTARPVLLFVHGGGWGGGRKEIYACLAREFVSLGYVVVLVNYRLHPEVRYPTFVEDAAAAVRWTVDHVGEYGGDPNAITLAGHSAGAHIVAWLGLDGRFLAEQGVDRATLRGVVGMSGPYDLPGLVDYLEGTLNWQGTELHLAAIMGGKSGLLAASPVQCTLQGALPFLLLHGRKDRLVPFQQAEKLAARLEAAGGSVRLVPLRSHNHFSVVLDLFGRLPELPDSVVLEIDRFARQAA